MATDARTAPNPHAVDFAARNIVAGARPLTERRSAEQLTQLRLDEDQIAEYFTYHRPTGEDVELMEEVRSYAKRLCMAMARCGEPSADRAFAIRLVRMGVAMFNAGVVLEDSMVPGARV